MAPGQEIAIRALGTALAGLSLATAIHMLAYGGGKSASTARNTSRSSLSRAGSRWKRLPSNLPPRPSSIWRQRARSPAAGKPALRSRPAEIVAARADRVWLRIDGAIRAAAPGDSVAGVGRIGAIVARNGGWVLLDDKGATLLTVANSANGAGRQAALAAARFAP